MFSAAKLFFAYGLGNCDDVSDVGRRRRRCCCPTGRRPTRCWTTMRRYQPTIFAGVPTLYRGAAGAIREIGPGAGSDRLRRCISAGEALPAAYRPALARAWSACDILDGIGSTEMLHIFLSNRPDDIRYGTIGQAGAGLRAAMIVDEHGGRVADGEAGELVVRGPSRRRGLLEPARQDRGAPSAASGPTPATPISATRTAITATAAAPTTC